MRVLASIAVAIVALVILAGPRVAAAQSGVDIPIGCGPKTLTHYVEPSVSPSPLEVSDPILRSLWFAVFNRFGQPLAAAAPRAPRFHPMQRAADPGPAVLPARRAVR